MTSSDVFKSRKARALSSGSEDSDKEEQAVAELGQTLVKLEFS